jgi:hypothetical protein
LREAAERRSKSALYRLDRLLLGGFRGSMNIERILVPVDYSACSRGALRFAVELGRHFDGTLDVVHVWDRPSYVSDVVMTRSDPLSPKSLIVMIQENAQRDLNEFMNGAELPVGTALLSRLLIGDPASALLRPGARADAARKDRRK